MNKDSAAINAKNLAKVFEQELRAFFEKPLIEKLEVMRKRIASDNSQLTSIIDELKERTDEWETSGHIEFHDSSIYAGIKYYCEDNFQDLLCFIALQAFIAAPTSHLTATYQNELREKNNLTSSELRDAIFKTLKKNYPGEIEHGGDRRKFWNKPKRLYFLAIYNRFQIIIKNARKDLVTQKRDGKRESFARREVIEKYRIPEDYSDLTFSGNSPSTLAMDWAKKVMGINQEPSSIRKDVLPVASKEAAHYDSTHKLISVHNLNLNLAVGTAILHKESKAELRFTDLWTDKFTMLYFI